MFELLLQADKALAAGSLDQAERTYWQLIDLDPSNAIAVAGLARVALERGDETSARAFADQALAIDPESIAARRVIDTIAHTGPARGDDVMDLPLLAAERLEAMSRRRATGPAEEADRSSDEGAAVPKAGGPRKVASGAPVENPSAGAPQPKPGTKAVRASAAGSQHTAPMPAEPLRERRKAGRLAAAAAAAAAAAREPVHARHEPHRAMPLGRRYFETAELKPTQIDEFSEAEMAAAIEAVDALEEPAVSSGGFPPQPGSMPKDDQSALLGAVETTAPDESVALRLALLADVVETDAAEREAAEYQDIENEDDSFEAAEAMASSGLLIQPRAPHETRPTYIVGAADDFDAAESGAAESAAVTRIADAEAEAEAEASGAAEAASQTKLEAEAAAEAEAAVEAMAEAKTAAATEPEPAQVRRDFKIEDESEPSEEAAEAQALREALAQVLAGEPAVRSAGAEYAGAPIAAATAATPDTVPLDTTDTTDTTEEGPSTEESSPEPAPRKGGLFRRIRGN